MLRISLQSHSTICIFTRSHKKMWVPYVTGTPKMSQIGSLILWNRPYALTSRLHNNDAMLGVKTCRAARTCCAGAERIGAQPLSQCAGPGQPGGMACRGWPSGCMLGDGARGSATFDPQRAWAPFCDVICIRSITHIYLYWTVKKRDKVYTGNF